MLFFAFVLTYKYFSLHRSLAQSLCFFWKNDFLFIFIFLLGFLFFKSKYFIFVLVLVLVRGGLDTLSKHLNSDGIFTLNQEDCGRRFHHRYRTIVEGKLLKFTHLQINYSRKNDLGQSFTPSFALIATFFLLFIFAKYFFCFLEEKESNLLYFFLFFLLEMGFISFCYSKELWAFHDLFRHTTLFLRQHSQWRIADQYWYLCNEEDILSESGSLHPERQKYLI